MTSPYSETADAYRSNGFHALPVGPGTKVPGQVSGGEWRPMSGWSRFCDAMPAPFVHEGWAKWPDAGVCIAHGNVIGLDLDTDREDVARALHEAVTLPFVRRRGSKGWLGYYRPGKGLDGLTARVRWYDGDGNICVELLLHGTQSVLPPTIHPGTGQPYHWLTPDTLEDTELADLPEFTGDDLAALDREFAAIGLTRQAPRRVRSGEYGCTTATDHDLEKPFGRSLNDRAMEPAALDRWWPALNLPKSRQRGVGAWEAVPSWRASNSGRMVHDRNPNLKATPRGIVDFGADRSYTPADVVMAARDCSFATAAEWLGQFVRDEAGADVSAILAEPEPDRSRIGAGAEPERPAPYEPDRWAPTPVFSGKRSWSSIKPARVVSEAEWEALIPKDVPAFPLPSFDVLDGLLGDVARHLDNASATATEAGALAVALPLLGAAMGRAYATPTDLRTNVYSVALGGSGTGKTSLVNPAKELIQLAQIGDVIGQDRIASGSGLLRMLNAYPRRICFLDEFGHMLQQIGSGGAGIHAKQIVTEFTALYSAANTLFAGTAYATQEPATIDCPHLCLFGMATPDQFWRAFGSASLEDGSIARYLVFPLGQTAPKGIDKAAADEVADAMRGLQAAINGRVSGNLGRPRICVAPLNDAAQRGAQALKDKETAFAEYAEANAIRGGGAILRRVTENALKIALISAVGRNYDNPEIDGRDMDIGHALAWWSANVMISNIASHIADNQYERDVNEIERFIRDGADRGRSMMEVGKRFRGVKRGDRLAILEALEEAGSVAVQTIPNPSGGRATKVFRAT